MAPYLNFHAISGGDSKSLAETHKELASKVEHIKVQLKKHLGINE
jgi:hypothetical protein